MKIKGSSSELFPKISLSPVPPFVRNDTRNVWHCPCARRYSPCKCVHTYVYIYIRMYVYMYVYIYTWTLCTRTCVIRACVYTLRRSLFAFDFQLPQPGDFSDKTQRHPHIYVNAFSFIRFYPPTVVHLQHLPLSTQLLIRLLLEKNGYVCWWRSYALADESYHGRSSF